LSQWLPFGGRSGEPTERAAVEEALQEIREGHTVSHEEVKRRWGWGEDRVRLEIEWAASAQREADRLDRQVRRRMVVSLDRYAEAGHGGVTRLTT
jgi:hypothetical protein